MRQLIVPHVSLLQPGAGCLQGRRCTPSLGSWRTEMTSPKHRAQLLTQFSDGPQTPWRAQWHSRRSDAATPRVLASVLPFHPFPLFSLTRTHTWEPAPPASYTGLFLMPMKSCTRRKAKIPGQVPVFLQPRNLPTRGPTEIRPTKISSCFFQSATMLGHGSHSGLTNRLQLFSCISRAPA